MMVRTPIKVKRKAITKLSKAGNIKSGGWFIFNKPKDSLAPKYKIPKNGSYKVLWCPYCAEWTLFKNNRENDRYECQGYCGWAHTDEYDVKTANSIWWDGVSLAEIKKLDLAVTRPIARRAR